MTTGPSCAATPGLKPGAGSRARCWARHTPWVPGHVVTGPEDTSVVPHLRHPAFHGALNRHSSVHVQWSLVTPVDRYAVQLGRGEAAAVRALLGLALSRAWALLARGRLGPG